MPHDKKGAVLLLLAIATVFAFALSTAAAAPLEVVTAEYRPDTPFPQFLPLWTEGWARMHAGGESLQAIQDKNPLGGYLHVYLHNTSDRAVDASDVVLNEVSLSRAVAFAKDEVSGFRPASIQFFSPAEAEKARLAAAGEPVWWRIDPDPIPPGSFAELVVRLRRNPKEGTLPVRVLADTTPVEARVDTSARPPRIASIAFSSGLDEVTLYLRHPREAAPSRCLVDAADVTATTAFGTGGGSDTIPVVIRLPRPLTAGSFHQFRAGYSDGSMATAAVRAFGNDLVYGMWGYTNPGDTPEKHAKLCLTDLSEHLINVHMGMGGDWGPFIRTEAGFDFLESIGMRMMVKWIGDTRNPRYYFLMDEPDAHDHAVSQLPVSQRLGALAQPLVAHGETLRRRDPVTPHLLNIDNTFKPENWYTYGQLPDVFCADPYYQEQLSMMYGARPGWLAHFVKPTYVYAAATVCRSAAQPRPVHIILNSVRHDHKEQPFRFATPVEKRIELYYALAAGATGFSYWWYAPYDKYYGVGGSGPEAEALWKEIGLLGAEVRTAGPVITRSCPAQVPVEAKGRLWVRTLLAGLDTLVIVVVNDNFASDRVGTVIYPAEKASLTVTPPAWLHPKDGFQITYEGTRDLTWKQAEAQVRIDLGTVEATRLILLTADDKLRPRIEDTYKARFSAAVTALRKTGS